MSFKFGDLVGYIVVEHTRDYMLLSKTGEISVSIIGRLKFEFTNANLRCSKIVLLYNIISR